MKIINSLTKVLGFTLFDFYRNKNNSELFNIKYWLLSVGLWFVLLPFLILQLIGVFILFDLLRLNNNKRKLTYFELTELKSVYGDSINYNQIRIRKNSKWASYGSRFIGAKHLGFVFLNTIHFSRQIDSINNQSDMAWLVHEVTHVSQYQKCGIVYAFKALRAQKNGGYSYSQEWLGIDLKQSNFEQQADISKCYYLDSKNHKDLKKYDLVLNDIRNQRFV